jgi:hypothetical protein
MAALAGALALAAATSAHAGAKVMVTAPAMHIYPAAQTMYCDIVNVGKVPADVTIEAVDYFGSVTAGPITQTLPPFNGTALGDSATDGGAFCRFTVSGSTKSFRAMAIYDNGSSYTVAVPAQ